MSRITVSAIAAVVVFLSFSASVLAQSKPGTVKGVVRDKQGKAVPEAEVRAARIGAEAAQFIQPTKTNEDGSYKLSLSPGDYAISVGVVWPEALQLGFDFVQVRSGETHSVDLTLIELALNPITTTFITGTIVERLDLVEDPLPSLPFAGTDPLVLVPTLPGFAKSPLGHEYDIIGGLPLRTVNTVRDGSVVADAMYPLGAGSVTALNSAMISEIRLILAPVDAEAGRGNGQIQITTRSGTNRFQWSTQTHLHNSAFDALGPDPERKKQPFNAALEYVVQAAGPIVKNRAFFMVNWDQQFRTARPDSTGLGGNLTVPVLTPYARQGIFRFWDGWNSADASMTGPYDGALKCFSVFGNVKLDGSPFTAADCGTGANPKPAVAITRATPWDTFGRIPDSTGYIQRLLAYMPLPNSYSGNGDGLNLAAFASVRSQTGLDTESTFRGSLFGRGLNLDQASATRRVFHVKTDYNVSSSIRVTVGLDLQKDRNSRAGLQSPWPDGIDGYSVRLPRVFVLNTLSTLSATQVNEARFGITRNRSTYLAPWDSSAGEKTAAFASSFLQQGWIDPHNGLSTPVYYSPGVGTMNFSSNVLPALDVNTLGPCWGSASLAAIQSCETGSTLYQFSDTFSMNHGNHSFRAGAEWRLLRASEVESTGIPNATAGASANTASELASLTAFPELQGRLQAAATDSASLLYFLSGSVASVSQPFWANSIDNFTKGTWETWSSAEGKKIRNSVEGEFAFFFKDDWNATKRLKLNLGVRYENYGNLYTRGFSAGIQDAGYGLFGPSRIRGASDPFDYWLTRGQNYVTGYGFVAPAIDVAGAFLPNGAPAYVSGGCGNSASTCPAQSAAGSLTSTVACVYGVQQSPLLPVSTCDPSVLTTHIFVGPGSSHPKIPPVYRDGNNFGPAVGFSLRLPGPGTRTMLIRGGIQTTFDSAKRNLSVASGVGRQLGQVPGLDNTALTCDSTLSCLGMDRRSALTLADLPNVTPFAPSFGPATGASVIGAQDWSAQRAISATAFAPDYRDPYTTNLTLSVSMNLSRSATIAVSYAGTLGRQRPTAVDLNTSNVYNNPELLDALVRTRAGEDAPLFDQMLAGLNLSGLGAASGYGNIGTCVAPTNGFAPGPGGAAGNCPAGSYYQSGSAHLRRSSAFQSDLANGNFAAVASTLATFGDFTEGSVISSSTEWGHLLKGRALRNGCDRLANTTSSNRTDLISGNATSGNTGAVRCFPEDYIIANPALGAAVYKAGWGFTNYHQLQTQFTMRAPSGTSFQATYVFSKLLALPRDFYKTNTSINDPDAGLSFGSVTGFSDPRTAETRRRDYGLSSSSFTHMFLLNGIFYLPIGPGQPLLGRSQGWLGQLLGGWHVATVFNARSGQPFSIIAADMLYGSSQGLETPSGLVNPDVVSPLWQSPLGRYRQNGPDGSSTYFGNPSPFALIRDPQCDDHVGQASGSDPGPSNLSALCTLKALAMKVAPGTPGAVPVSAGSSELALIMLQNPLPGQQGTLGSQTMKQPGAFSFDASLSKGFVFRDHWGAEFSVEAFNALNHATPADVLIDLGPSGIYRDRTDGVLAARSTVPRRIEMSFRLSF